jgi:micrococcal nuclease
MSEYRWLWKAALVRVVDGDTIDVVIDVGFHGTRTERLRLVGVNTPEMHGATKQAGLQARDFTDKWLRPWPAPDGWPLVIETFKGDAFGRYLARVWHADAGGQPEVGTDLSSALLAAGMAVPYER